MQFDRKMQEQQGVGLGLAIAKRLAELHGGTLAIEGAKGAGTTVTVKLPKAKTGLTAFQSGSRGVKPDQVRVRQLPPGKKTSAIPTTGAKSTLPARNGIFRSGASKVCAVAFT